MYVSPQVHPLTTGRDEAALTESLAESSRDAVQLGPQLCPQGLRVKVGNWAPMHPSINHPCTPSFHQHPQRSTLCQA